MPSIQYIRIFRHFSWVISLGLALAAGFILITAFQRIVFADDPQPETVFTIAQVPDTQNEVMQDTNPLMPGRYQWLANNKDTLNLKFIAHVGDVVNWGVADPVQFTRAGNWTNILDASPVPYIYATGNHDTGAVTVGGSAAPGITRDNLRNTTAFNQTFPVSRFKNVVGTYEAGKVDNLFQTFQAGGSDWLVITHEMWPRQGVIDWMKGIAQSYPNHNIIVNTHAFTNQNGDFPITGFYGDTTAQSEWDQFISQYANIKMVLSGHYGPSVGNGTSYTERTGVNGNKVALVMTAYHSGYQNHVRLLKINTQNNTIESSVYVANSTSASYPTGYVTDVNSNFIATGMNWIGGGGGGTQTVPGAPYAVTATPNQQSATVSFSPPLLNGNSPITSYTVTSNPGGKTATGTSSPLIVTGLTAGTSYTFNVTATNAIGTGPASSPSAAITPFSNAPELLSDPGFETTTSGWAPFIVGTHSRVASPVRSGSQALKIAATTSTSNWVGMMNTGVVPSSSSGYRYTAQCYVRPEIAGRNFQIRLLQYTQNYSSSTNIGQVSLANVGNGNWTLLRVSGTATASGMRVIPQLYATNQTTLTGTVAYDDCSVIAEPPATVPGQPAITSVSSGNGSAVVDFSTPTDTGNSPITSYTVTSNPGSITVTGAASPLTVNGLRNGTAYTFTVTATNAVGTSQPSVASNPVTPSTVPAAPSDLSAVRGDTTASLSWAAPTDNGGSNVFDYEIWYRISGSSNWLHYEDDTSSATNATVSNLINTEAYDFFVAAVNASGTGSTSTIVSTQPFVLAVAPSEPLAVQATAQINAATVSFEAPTNDGGSPVLDYTVTAQPSGATMVAYASPASFQNLTAGQAYTFTVTARNAAGNSTPSTPSNSVTPYTTASEPQNLVATAVDGGAQLTWDSPLTDGSAAITDYSVWYRVAGNPIWILLVDENSTVTTTTVSGLSNQSAHEFRVAAVNAAGTGQTSALVTAPAYTPVTQTIPGSPESVSAVAGAASATVSFSPPANDGNSPITSYSVTATPGGATISGASSPIVINGLENGTPYTFTVTATNAIGTSSASSTSNSVTPVTTPSTPLNLQATPGNASVSLSWNEPTSNGGTVVTDYFIEYEAAQSGIWVGYADGVSTALSSTVTNLTNGTSYRFRVSALNLAGTGSSTAPTQAVTPISPELLPDPGFENGTGSWTAFTNGTLITNTNPIRTGSKAMNIAATSSSVQLVGMTQNAAVSNSTQGKTYRFSCYVRPSVSGRNFTIRLLEYTQNFSSNIKIGTVNRTNIANTGWTLLEITGTATASGKRIIPQIYATNQTTSTGTVSYDDCSFSILN